MFEVSIDLPESELAAAVGLFAKQAMLDNAERAGALIVKISKDRIQNEGDEEKQWPPMWADDDSAVRGAIEKTTGKDEQQSAKVILKKKKINAKKNLDRTREKIRSGAIPAEKARKRIRRARNRFKATSRVEASGNTSYRKGGQQLRDTGKLFASLADAHDSEGDGVRIELTGLFYGAFMQEGFETDGPNFIPLTKKASQKEAGAKPEDVGLVPGIDYVMAWQGVEVPQRDIFRLTKSSTTNSYGPSPAGDNRWPHYSACPDRSRSSTDRPSSERATAGSSSRFGTYTRTSRWRPTPPAAQQKTSSSSNRTRWSSFH